MSMDAPYEHKKVIKKKIRTNNIWKKCKLNLVIVHGEGYTVYHRSKLYQCANIVNGWNIRKQLRDYSLIYIYGNTFLDKQRHF